MTVSTLNYASLFKRLSSGLLLVTANSRLARVLAGQYTRWRIERGDQQWLSADIISWDALLNRLWETAGLQGLEGLQGCVPANQQLLSLWEGILKNDPKAGHLLRPESLASRLRDTRKLAVDWRLDLHHPSWLGDDNENHTHFHHWNSLFDSLCRRHGWIAPEDRSSLLCDAIGKGGLPVPAEVGLLGFDELNPGQAELIDAIRSGGCSIEQLEIASQAPAPKLWQGASSREELEQMARCVRYWFEQNPDAQIAVVVPDLQARRAEVERQLEKILTPGSHAEPGKAKPWNVSLGRQLANVPMIESAFDLLRLLNKRIDIQDIGRVLRSPWVKGGEVERDSRALLEKCLRENYPRQLKLDEVRYRAGEIRKHDHNRQELPPEQWEPRSWSSPVLGRLIQILAGFERKHTGTRLPSSWAESFDGLLSSLGWPLGSEAGSTGPGEHSENWQTFQVWQDALRELATLDVTVPRLSCGAATGKLLQICRERVFQPHTPPANIQVLGLYEISGLRFDHLWVLGLHNNNWPPAAQPNPFIPGVLQQQASLPQSSPQRELEVARTVTQRLLETAPDCVFSYAGSVDGEDVLPSPLLTTDSIESCTEVPGWQGESWQTVVGSADAPQTITLNFPDPLQRGTARGGSSILKHQALCPFRAFASNRLGADGLETPADGISPMLHGSLMHKVLELFWEETRTLEALLALDEESTEARIRGCVDLAVSDERGLTYRPGFRQVEADRLARLAAASLELEKTRAPFEVIGFEREIMHEIEGQTIRLIIDRVDRLVIGDDAIIDYKTGNVDPKKWFGDRPEDPQLPLYAISAGNTPAALAFAVLRDDGCLYRGVVTRDGLFPGLPPAARPFNQDIIGAGEDMPATIENWRQILHRLMAEFLAGEASIDPKDGSNTCKNSYCELQPLCRINELEQLQKTNSAEVVS
jgi:ATP-dependent helicase/nuclease subunit B